MDSEPVTFTNDRPSVDFVPIYAADSDRRVKRSEAVNSLRWCGYASRDV